MIVNDRGLNPYFVIYVKADIYVDYKGTWDLDLAIVLVMTLAMVLAFT